MMLFDEKLLKEALEQYKNDFPGWVEKGKYKWEAVATFQEHWNIGAPNFDTMFKASVSKTEDLLTPYSGSKAKDAIISLAEKAPEDTRAVFKALFNKDGDVLERIQEFKAKTSELYDQYKITYTNESQNEYTATAFLWLRYPEDYYIYKTNVVCTLAARIGHIHSFRVSFDKNYYNEFYDFYSKICSYICKDENLINTVKPYFPDEDASYYKDLNHKILTADFIAYIKQKDDDDNSYDGYWWLVASSSVWSLSGFKDGQVQNYTLKNKKNKKRQIYHNFFNVKIGDKVIGYRAGEDQQLVAICEIAGEADGKDIKVKKLENIAREVDLDTLRTIPEIQNMEWFKAPNGSLFKLKKSEYDCIMELINGTYEYPPPYSDSGPDPKPGPKNDYQRNLIFFGAPGTGKSHDLNKLKDAFFDDYRGDYERVTFHPDYSYAHFVGTYKPVVPGNDPKKYPGKGEMEGEITYKYVPGPFMRIYAKAKTNPGEKFLLIIEEINRANVAAVFGDVFQLLDRAKDGASEYPIAASEDVQGYLSLSGIKDYEKVAIPPNMYIWATMNSADQGVFPMDTAFKRRWEFKYLGIDHGEDAEDENGVKIGDKEVPLGNTGKSIGWNILRKTINELLASENINVNEDKQLGMFFINKEIIDNAMNDKKAFNETFKNKVLMYLFEDAAKHKRRELFGSKTIRYSEVCKNFEEKGLGVFVGGIDAHKEVKGESKTADEPDKGNNQDHAGVPAWIKGEND